MPFRTGQFDSSSGRCKVRNCLSCANIIIDALLYQVAVSETGRAKDKIQRALVDCVVEDFVNITTPIKQFPDAVLAPVGTLFSQLLT